MVRAARFELAQCRNHRNLNPTRLPIPPRPHRIPRCVASRPRHLKTIVVRGVVRPEGLEPSTNSLKGYCSTD